MTVQIAAASTALILGHERRKRGRWVGWSNDTLQSSVKSRAESEALRCAGLVLDELGPAHLREVRDPEMSESDTRISANGRERPASQPRREPAERRPSLELPTAD